MISWPILRIVVKLLPKSLQLDVAAPFVAYSPELHGENAARFIDALEARANGGQITPAMVLDTLRKHSPDA